MAVPKKKTSKGRTTRRHHAYVTKQRAKLTNQLALVECSNCKEPRRAHHVCSKCGFFKGRVVIDMAGKDLDKITTIKA